MPKDGMPKSTPDLSALRYHDPETGTIERVQTDRPDPGLDILEGAAYGDTEPYDPYEDPDSIESIKDAEDKGIADWQLQAEEDA